MIAVAVLSALAWIPDGGAAPLYVDANLATGNNDGSSWGNAFTNLQEAIAAAGNNAELWVATGLYYPADSSTSVTVTNSRFLLKYGMTIYGGFTNGMTDLGQRDWGQYPTVLSGDLDRNGILDTNNSRFIVWMGTNTAVDGCHIMHGYSKELALRSYGCAVNTFLGSSSYLSTNFALRNCVIAHNAAYGGNSGNKGFVVASEMSSGRGLISNCVFAANVCSVPANAAFSGVILGNYAHTLTIKNALFLWNRTGYGIYKENSNLGLNIGNSTFLRNYGVPVYAQGAPTWTISNSIAWGNSNVMYAISAASAGTASYCDIQGSGGSTAWTLAATNIVDGTGNIDADPSFVDGPSGTWTAGAVYDGASFRTVLTDGTKAFGDLRGKYLVTPAAAMSNNCFYILSNTGTQIVVLGKADAVGIVGNGYAVMDAHLKPKSPCIDAGDPHDPVGAEPAPNGNRINMGVYGGTREAEIRSQPGLTLMIR